MLLRAAGSAPGERGDVYVARLLEQFETTCQQFKSAVLQAGSAGAISPRQMAAVLEYGGVLRRTCNQAGKAVAYLDRFLAAVDPAGEAREEAAAATPSDPG